MELITKRDCLEIYTRLKVRGQTKDLTNTIIFWNKLELIFYCSVNNNKCD